MFYTALTLVHTVYLTNYQKTKLVSCYGVQILWNNKFFREMGNIRILSIIIYVPTSRSNTVTHIADQVSGTSFGQGGKKPDSVPPEQQTRGTSRPGKWHCKKPTDSATVGAV